MRKAVTIDAVETYIKYKALDVIGNGQYKKFVYKEKDEEWAKEILENVAVVSAKVKFLQSLVNDLQTTGKKSLFFMCQTVIENNTPPIEQNTVISQCCISNKKKCQCIVLKCKGRGAPCITVQTRFGHFILMLWTVFKMDLVIKTVTKDFIDTKMKDVSSKANCTLQEISASLLNDSQDIKQIAKSLFHGIQHVEKSLKNALIT